MIYWMPPRSLQSLLGLLWPKEKEENKTTGINKIRSSQKSSPTLNKKSHPLTNPTSTARDVSFCCYNIAVIFYEWVTALPIKWWLTSSLLFGPLWTYILFYGWSYSQSLRSFVFVNTELLNWKVKSFWECEQGLLVVSYGSPLHLTTWHILIYVWLWHTLLFGHQIVPGWIGLWVATVSRMQVFVLKYRIVVCIPVGLPWDPQDLTQQSEAQDKFRIDECWFGREDIYVYAESRRGKKKI